MEGWRSPGEESEGQVKERKEEKKGGKETIRDVTGKFPNPVHDLIAIIILSQ